MIAPVVDALASKRAGLLKVVKVNVDSEPLLGARFGIQATPKFFLYRNGFPEITGAVLKTTRYMDDSSLSG
jgi:thioredoxin-like negative regulator of GroEL